MKFDVLIKCKLVPLFSLYEGVSREISSSTIVRNPITRPNYNAKTTDKPFSSFSTRVLCDILVAQMSTISYDVFPDQCPLESFCYSNGPVSESNNPRELLDV